MKNRIISLLATLILATLTPALTQAQDFDLDKVINVSWCVGTKIVNPNGVVRDCGKDLRTPKCREQSSLKGSLLIISAVCSAR